MKKLYSLLLVLGLILILLPSASAVSKSYDEDTKTVTIIDTFLFIPIGDIAEIQLQTPLHNEVGLGYQRVAEFELRGKKDWEDLFYGDTKTYNKHQYDSGEEIELDRNFDWKYKTEETYLVDDYTCNDINLVNGTTIENCFVSGTHENTREVWLPFDINSLVRVNQNVVIGLYTDVQQGDYVEWIPKFAGEKIEEWATWSASLNVGLKYAWAFNENSGTTAVENVSKANNLTMTADLYQTQVNCKLGGCIGINIADGSNATSLANVGIINAEARTISFWAYTNQSASTGGMVAYGGKAVGNLFGVGTTNIKLTYFGYGGPDQEMDGLFISSNSWTMVTLTNDGTIIRGYLNNSVPYNYTYTSNTTDAPLEVGMPGLAIDGIFLIDNLLIWNRTLNAAEINTLYNGGVGMEYTTSFPPTVTLNTPVNNKESLNPIITFNSTVESSGTLINVSLLIDGVVDQTNTSTIKGNYIFTKTLTVGNHNWSILAYDSIDSTTASTRNISVVSWELIGEDYSNSTVEGNTEKIAINITLASGKQISTSYLNYNGTSYSGSHSLIAGSNYTISSTIGIPIVNADTNVTFNWNITLSDGFTKNSTTHNQTIISFSIDDCSVNTEVLYNFTIVDEKSQNRLVPVSASNLSAAINLQIYTLGTTTELVNLTTEITNINPFGVCLNNNFSSGESYTLAAQIQYGGNTSSITGYVTELYHIQNKTLTNSDFPTNITLYDLDNVSSQDFIITYKDSLFAPVDGALINVQRKYISEGLFKSVEIPKTDAQGETVAHLQLEDTIYTFSITKGGTTLATFDNVIPVCQNPSIETCTIAFNSFSSYIAPKDFTTLDDFTFTLGFNEDTREISSIFTVPSGTPATIRLNVSTMDALSSEACTQTLLSSSGTLACTVPSTFGNGTVLASIYKNDLRIGQGTISLSQEPEDIYGTNLIFLSLFLYLTLIGLAISGSPMITAFFFIIAAFFGILLNVVDSKGLTGEAATILWLVIALVIIIIKSSNRQQ